MSTTTTEARTETITVSPYRIGHHRLDPGAGWMPSCTCGWYGAWYKHVAAARCGAEEHAERYGHHFGR